MPNGLRLSPGIQCDLLNRAVQAQLLRRVRAGEVTWVDLRTPCTTFCRFYAMFNGAAPEQVRTRLGSVSTIVKSREASLRPSAVGWLSDAGGNLVDDGEPEMVTALELAGGPADVGPPTSHQDLRDVLPIRRSLFEACSLYWQLAGLGGSQLQVYSGPYACAHPRAHPCCRAVGRSF